jgi:ubiquinone/menaquinone biosynthesis C-methylase UbiE
MNTGLLIFLLDETMTEYLDHQFSIDDFDLVSVIDDVPLWSAPFGMKLLDSIELESGMTVLDIGCGLGFPMIEIAQRLGETSRVVGLDPWGRALQRIHLKTRTYGIENAWAVQGAAERMPFNNASFDLLVSNNGLNNVQELKAALLECRRVAKPGAQLVLTLNLEDTMSEFYEVFEKTLAELGLQAEVDKMIAQIYDKRKPLHEIKTLLEEAGFHERRIEEDRFRLRYADAAALFNHYLIKYWFLAGWKNILHPKDQKAIFERLEARLDETASKEGEIALTVPYATLDYQRWVP